MLKKVTGAVNRAGYSSRFDAYFGAVYGKGLPGAPTREEAQRDFREMLRLRKSGY